MTTKWTEENWWFACGNDAEEAKVEAFRAWMRGNKIEYKCGGHTWSEQPGFSMSCDSLIISMDCDFRPIHPHRALIDQYEPGQEWEIEQYAGHWETCASTTPSFNPKTNYRLKQSAPVVDWPAMPAWAEWVAMDESGEWWHYREDPALSDSRYGLDSGGCAGDIPLEFHPKYTGDWKQSKTRRPK